jgi:hypothetical protein
MREVNNNKTVHPARTGDKSNEDNDEQKHQLIKNIKRKNKAHY